MAARSKARKRAVDVLYEADARSVDTLDTLRDRIALSDPPVNDYTIELVEGARGHRRRIDEILSRYAEGWTIDRMPDVDRAVLRLGVYELLFRPDVPDAVVIDEAVELAKTLSTDESPRFVNGVLARVLRDRAELLPAVPEPEPAAVEPEPEEADAEPADAGLEPVPADGPGPDAALPAGHAAPQPLGVDGAVSDSASPDAGHADDAAAR